MKVSEQTRQHLNKMRNETRELRAAFSLFQDALAIKICNQSVDSVNQLINVLNNSHHLQHHQKLRLLQELQSRLETAEKQISGALEMDISEPVKQHLLHCRDTLSQLSNALSQVQNQRVSSDTSGAACLIIIVFFVLLAACLYRFL
jgi:predicted PurR-regulated permease PerM